MRHKKLSLYAAEIEADWQNVSIHARPYLDALKSLDQITEAYGLDSASYCLIYFLANAQSWRGEVARATKKELKKLYKDFNENERMQKISRENIDKAYRS
jgi:hypothetical protein